jgi:FdhD protein
MAALKKSVAIRKFSPDGWETTSTPVITEAQVSLSVNGEPWLAFLCTPNQLEALGAGFLLNEGVIESADEFKSLQVCDNGTHIDAWLSHAASKPEQWLRTSGCGGGETRGNQPLKAIKETKQFQLPPQRLLKLMTQFLKSQNLHQESGGVHSAALSDGESLLLQVEDIGRHNTLDKLAGRLLLENIVIDPRILLTTGRVSSEMLQKTARLNASILVSRTSPTALSVELAEQVGITLVGYARGGRFSVYTHSSRIS